MTIKSFILACDGGGIRGLATAAVLATIEERLQRINPGKPLLDYFDLIAGTSTGSIVACGLSSGLTARQILDLYLRDGINIFPPFNKVWKSILERIRLGYSQPIYQAGYEDKGNPQGVEPVLQRVFSYPQGEGLLKFGDLQTPTLVTSYDTYNQQFIVFKSRSSECKELDVWEVARASSAAPGAFPAYELSNKTFIDFWKARGFLTIPSRTGEHCIPLIDGGLSANNPAMCALVERLSWSQDRIPMEEIAILSIGTGNDPITSERDGTSYRQLNFQDASGWGLMEWLSPRRDIPLLRATSDGSSDAVEYQAKTLLAANNYYRLQPVFQNPYESFNANTDNLNGMLADTSAYLLAGVGSATLERLITALVNYAD